MSLTKKFSKSVKAFFGKLSSMFCKLVKDNFEMQGNIHANNHCPKTAEKHIDTTSPKDFG